ncbi:MAG: hypothetical protein ACOZNI_21165 [Myxococcota bacterium]
MLGASRDVFSPVRPNPIEPLLGPASLIVVAGDRHARGRRLLVPAFAGERLRKAEQIVRSAAERERDGWRPVQVVDLVERARAITLDVMLEVVLGARSATERDGLRAAARAWMRPYTRPIFFVPALRRSVAGIGPWARFRRAWEAFDAVLDVAIARHSPDAEDVLGLLLAVRDERGAPLPRDEVKD